MAVITEEFQELLDMVENMEEADPDDPDNQGGETDVMYELIDEVTLGMCFEIHKACKMGTLFLDETDKESEKKYVILEEKGKDVFGHVPAKKPMECPCPNCKRSLAASRFAPHLEKCMGMGRNSSRIASRRIANAGKKDSDNESEDNGQDHDWNFQVDKKTKKAKRDRNNSSPRRGKISTKLKPSSSSLSSSQVTSSQGSQGSGDIPSVGSATSEGSGGTAPIYESFSIEEKKSLLTNQCGVISEHTKKMCTRSKRCPQHSDEQRKHVRAYLLGQPGPPDDEIHIDIDSYDDADSQSLRESLHWDAGSNASPADSTSTTTSTGSKKQKKRSKNSKRTQSKSSKVIQQGDKEDHHTGSLYDFS